MAGQVAVVTGGSSGIGAAIARRFAREGASVVIASRSLEACQAAAATIRADGGEASAVACDVTDEQSVIALFQQVVQAHGRLDIHVASAGISGGSTPLESYELADWDRVLRTNLTGSFLSCREAFKNMKQHGGHIIVISSQAGIEGYASKGVYCASKFGVRGMAHVLGEEGRPFGINVTALCPGTADTPILAATKTKVKHPLDLDALADAAVYLATLRGNALVRDILLERMNQR
jgi:NAD(P)-dependent dehydrogenase (short-subunit alcohol dehydrogenase family)